MNKSSLWMVVVIAAAWIAFLFGYAVSSHTGDKNAAGGPPAAESAGAGGASAGGYGK